MTTYIYRYGLLSMLLGCSGSGKVTITDSVRPSTENTETESVTDSANDTADTQGDDTADTDTANPNTGEEAPAPEPINLLQNPSFEDGDEHWGIWGGAARVEGHAQDGDWAIQATTTNGAEQVVELAPNTTYRLSGWGKVEGENGILIGVKNHGGQQKAVTFNSSEYTEDSLTFSTGLSNTSAVIFAYKHSGESPGYADNLTLTETGESPYTLVWADEFEGSGAPDSSKWRFEEGFKRNQELQWYQEENAFLEDGYLVIEGREEQRPNPNYDPNATDWRNSRENIEYTSASIHTKGLFDWQYGRMVVRAKVTNLAGTWPAIWMLGNECDWPSNGEIDVMENYGGKILGNFAWGSNQPWSPVWDAEHINVSDLGEGWTDDFHLWELVWSSTRMTIYLDGAEVNTVSLADTINGSAVCAGENPFQKPQYILLNLALGGNAGGSVEELGFPTRYWVDYVRVYGE
ncbi:MAG: family 16 glycosylhydrolase [Myxococcota bacterium]|nr:family 16 glycosylhydrolase [Myxococcota bacterium]